MSKNKFNLLVSLLFTLLLFVYLPINNIEASNVCAGGNMGVCADGSECNCVGGTCTVTNPDGSCGYYLGATCSCGGTTSSGFPSCSSEGLPPDLSCGPYTDPGAMYSTNFKGTCGAYFPAVWAGAGGNCQINCLCCPTGQTRSCTDTSTYEYLTTQNKAVICQNKADRYKSDRANPYYNWNLVYPDNPYCTETECYTRLTTCYLNSCSCVATNSPPTGTLSCPARIQLGQSGTFSLNGSDVNSNLQKAQLYRSPNSPVNPEGDWTQVGGDITCTGGNCTPTASWTPGAVGAYKITADYYDSSSSQCSGNPFIPYSSYPKYGYSACSNPLSNDSCTVNVYLDASCSASHYGCINGINPAGNNTGGTNVDGASAYTWVCNGLNGGTNISCSQTKTTPSCIVDLSQPAPLLVGSQAPITATVTTSGSIVSGGLTSNPESVAEVSFDSYEQTATGMIVNGTVTGIAAGNVEMTAQVSIFGGTGCFDTSIINVFAPTPPTPTPYPTVAISGNLKEYLGSSCYSNISTNTLLLNINPQYPAGVTSVCSVTPPTGQTKSSYLCTVAFDNQNYAPIPAQNLNLSVSATSYSSAHWTNANACTNTASNSLAVDVSSGGSTVYNKDIFFNNNSSWIKLKNSSFSKKSSSTPTGLTNVLPLSIAPYDAEDDASQRYFIMNSVGSDPGVVTASSINTGTADVSVKNWKADYLQSVAMNPTTFLSYVKSRKQYTKITALNEITKDGIYVWDDATIFPGITTATTPNFNFVLISTVQAITISGTDFSPGTGKSVAFVANSITFGASVQTANGLFIAQTIDTGSTGNQGLKIKGNLIALTSLTNNRSWSNNSTPSVFIVFDQTQYINLLPYLSTASYQWRQVQ